MNRKEYGSSHCFKLTVGFILLNALVMTGCATLGDIETANQRTQASVNSFKKESRERDDELARKIISLSKEIKNLENKDQVFNKQYDNIIKENQKLRASILGVTGTIKGFLSAEKRRHEEGLRWVDNANKTMGKETAKLSGTSPPKESAPSKSPPPGTPAAVAAPSKSPPPATPAAVPVSSPVTEEASTDSEQIYSPTIKILEIVIDPPKVERNSELKVTVKYDLQTDPEVPKLQYLEEIVLLKGTLSIQNLKDTVERDPGTISYSQTIEVPAEAPTGVYTIKGIVSSGSARNSKIKTFMVK